MKVLTVLQPYAEQIASGAKIIENRTWPAPPKLIGQRMGIHAGLSEAMLEGADPAAYVRGAIVATVELVACVRLDALPPHLLSRADAHGPWCWLLDKVARIEPPVRWRGMQGLWEWPTDPAQWS